MDDILIGAPLFMEREFESNPREVGQVYLYMQVSALIFEDPQVLAGTEVFGRFGSAVAHLGDLNQDGYNGNLHQCVEIVDVSILLWHGHFEVLTVVCMMQLMFNTLSNISRKIKIYMF